jgi:hypothetical protein
MPGSLCYPSRMSKAQEKKDRNIAEAAKFIKERRQVQMAVLESNFEAGVQIYLANKEKLSPEEIEVLEKDMEEAKGVMDRLKIEWGL